MSIIEAIVLGLVQGLTEFIPVSSSGHLLLVRELFGTQDGSLAFDVALHVGTLLALFIYFRKDLWELLRNISAKNSEGRLARLLVVATIPAAIAGLLFGDFIDEKLRSTVVVGITLGVIGVIMLIVDRKASHLGEKEVTTKRGMVIGFAQIAALIPGVSRSGATMTAGIFVGLNRKQAARFSFLMAVPIIAGSATGILLKDGSDLVLGAELAVGMLTAFVSGLIAIKFLMKVIAKVGLKPFAYYRIALAIIVLLFLV
jgi:undecaprenyl-diphosphatase